MEQLISHIEYLLENHECVTIPRVGALIKHNVSASIDALHNEIIPPHRSISFNGELTYDDGLLATSYARALGIPYFAAITKLNEDIDHFKGTLNNDGEIKIGELGVLSLNNDRIAEFSPALSLFNSFGYATLSLKETSTTNFNDPHTNILEYTPSRLKQVMHGVMKYAAMLVITLTLGIILSTPLNYDNNATLASLNPVSLVQTNTQDTLQDIHLGNLPDLLLADPSRHVIASDELELGQEVNIQDFKYCLVIASLATLEQAHDFMNQAGSDALGVFETNGRYRVYAATGMTIADLLSNKSLQERYPDAWPCEIE